MQENTKTVERQWGSVGVLSLWTVAWMATLALAVFGPGVFWDSQSVVSFGQAGSAGDRGEDFADRAGMVEPVSGTPEELSAQIASLRQRRVDRESFLAHRFRPVEPVPLGLESELHACVSRREPCPGERELRVHVAGLFERLDRGVARFESLAKEK